MRPRATRTSSRRAAAAAAHTPRLAGGTLHDVTDLLHPQIVEASIAAAKALDIPVVGLDFIVKAPVLDEFVFIEANERPGLANHEPQPVVERFLDLLFPRSARIDNLRPGADRVRA